MAWVPASPTDLYAALLHRAKLLAPRAIAPGSNGYRTTGPHAWFNAYKFPVSRERFVRETRTAASLDHPNVVPVFYAGEEDGRLYIAMVEAGEAAGVLDVVREFNLTQEQALKVSDHLPIWAEFSVYEGGRPGTVAARPAGAR